MSGAKKTRPTGGLLRGMGAFVRHFLRREEGSIAVQAAVIVPSMLVMSLGLIDVNRASVSKRNLQDALDAAALMVAKSDADTNQEAQSIGAAALAAQISTWDDATLSNSSFTLGGTNGTTVIATATASVTPVVANLWLQGNMSIGAKAEVMRSSYNLEVALVLDVTTSMAGTKVADLKIAAADLVDIVVQTSQTPYYTKMSIVPYSQAVNLGTSAATARGAIPAGKAITGASWASGTAKGISGATKANPVVITSNGHGFNNGDRVYISGVSGMTQLNGNVYTVAGKTTNTFQLSGVNGNNYNSYSSSSNDYVTKCQATNCEVVVTSAGHGFANNDWVYITGVNGMTNLNNASWKVTNQAANTYWLDDSFGPDYSAWTSGGLSYCTVDGCEYNRFTSQDGNNRVFRVSTCVTERTTSAYTDASPASALLGRNYPASGNPCLTSTVLGLTSNKTTLKSTITGLAASGSSGGHVGIAWGWYSISPNFTSIFSGSSAPAAYTAPNTKKVVILMTDGEYNSSYCKGVISQSSTSGSGSTNDHINCDAPNGHSFDQATALCTAMKNAGVIVYTVGFQVVNDVRAQNLVNNCATSSSHVYLPATGAALKDAFKAIGQDISSLRIAK